MLANKNPKKSGRLQKLKNYCGFFRSSQSGERAFAFKYNQTAGHPTDVNKLPEAVMQMSS